MVSANFAAVHKLDMFQLKKPIKLQMATSGSRSIINYGAKVELQVGELKEQRYFDVIMLNYAGYGLFKLRDRWFPVRDSEFGKALSKEGEKTDKPMQTIKGKEVRRVSQEKKMTASHNGKGNAKPAPDKRSH
ncbi:hypothetical protein AX14_009745 [Amanita brunnescens Koide BX004]|nr:hypothetical protein AX14_009745 [Amanita brunnescens Koide BX004]